MLWRVGRMIIIGAMPLIYIKVLGDNEKFLETKLHNMRYGSDYVDVVQTIRL